MNLDPYLLMALLPLLLLPPLIYYRQKVYNKKKAFVSVQCPRCGKFQDIRMLANYTCKKCGEEINFLQGEEILEGWETYDCRHCGQENPKGVISCTACGMTNNRGRFFND